MTRRECISRLPVGLALARSMHSQMTDDEKLIETAKIAVAAQRTFGLALLRDVAGRKPAENVFLSPLSVFLALHMTENGAAGTTRAAMRKALALPDRDAAHLNASSAALQSFLLKDPGALTIANALWADLHFTLAPEFVKLCESTFQAHAASLDFVDPQAAGVINDWIKTNTKGKIPSIVTPDIVRKAAVILTNAVYFAARWRSEFDPSGTVQEAFHKTGGSAKQVPMMHQSLIRGAYRSGDSFEGAMLYYKESSAYFYALLPRPGKTPKDVLASLDVDRLTGGPAEFDLDLKLPRFTLDFSTSLVEDLKKMGMDVAFHYPQADFGPMGSKEFFISDVIHKTRLEVDEKGTVAAAATAVIMRAGSAMPRPREKKVLVFDRPFVALIGEARTGAVLFAGVIEDP